jgi:hypothetical protein
MYQPHGNGGTFAKVSGYEQRMNEVVGILCGTPHDEGLIHVTRRTADTVDKLSEGLARTEKAIGNLADITTTQGARLATLEEQRDGVKEGLLGALAGILSWVASRGFLLVVSVAAIIWTYLYTVSPQALLPHQGK